ncbi:hypothetical protein J6590_072158 [Homalodisca vitripennis]|nr:hypothetical protein J6590_072158 [Homalodisca vitripennis]
MKRRTQLKLCSGNKSSISSHKCLPAVAAAKCRRDSQMADWCSPSLHWVSQWRVTTRALVVTSSMHFEMNVKLTKQTQSGDHIISCNYMKTLRFS